MATYKFVEVQMGEARYLADLVGIQQDLQAAIDFCNHLFKIYEMERNSELLEAVSIAILVKYSRPFASGVRHKLSANNLPEFTDLEIKQHKRFIDIRDKHIAHSVNKLEQNIVKAYYDDEKVYAEGIRSIEFGHRRIISLGGKDAETIIALSKKILNYVTTQIKAEKARILEIVRNQPINEILKVGCFPFDPNMEKVNKPRKFKQ